MRQLMKKRKNIEEEVNKTLHALDDIERVQPGPYFMARLEARLEQQPAPSILMSLWSEPRYALAAAAVLIIIMLNVFSVQQYRHYEEALDKQETEEVAALAEEHALNIPLLYSINEENNGY